MFGALGEVIGGIFGTEKAIDNIMDKDKGLLVKFGGWVDDFNYTDEERSRANAIKRDWAIRQLEALAPFKVVQRILAFAATTLWIIVATNVMVAMWVEAYNPALVIVQPMLELALSNYVWGPVSLAYGLYFGGGVIDSIKRKGA